MNDIKTKLIPMVAKIKVKTTIGETLVFATIEIENTIEEFLKYWYDTEGEDAKPTQVEYEHYCFERAHSVSGGKSAYDIVLVEQKTK